MVANGAKSMRLAELHSSAQHLARIIWECLQEEESVELDGLGIFRLRPGGQVEFIPNRRPKVFLAYVREDYQAAERLYQELLAAGFDPWLDRKKLLPGQNWPRAIEREIAVSDSFIPILSRRSLSKRGQFHAELRHALYWAGRMPLEETFVIPVRLEECTVPDQIAGRLHYVDLFPDWSAGVAEVIASLRAKAAAVRD